MCVLFHYQVYICTVDCDPVLAASRNTHQRTEAETVLLARGWEETPSHMNTLDVREFLQTDAIPHVEMTEADADESNGDTNEEISEISQNDEEEVRVSWRNVHNDFLHVLNQSEAVLESGKGRLYHVVLCTL